MHYHSEEKVKSACPSECLGLFHVTLLCKPTSAAPILARPLLSISAFLFATSPDCQKHIPYHSRYLLEKTGVKFGSQSVFSIKLNWVFRIITKSATFPFFFFDNRGLILHIWAAGIMHIKAADSPPNALGQKHKTIMKIRYNAGNLRFKTIRHLIWPLLQSDRVDPDYVSVFLEVFCSGCLYNWMFTCKQ